MSDVNLNIVLKLIDEAGDQIRKSLGQINEETEKTEKETKSSSDAMTKSWTTVSLKVASVISAIMLTKKAITEMISVGKQIDPEFKKSFQNFEVSVFRAKAAIAEELIPILKTALDYWTEFLNQKFSGSNEGVRYYSAEIEKASSNIEIMTNKQSRLNAAMENAKKLGNSDVAQMRAKEIEDLQEAIALERMKIGVMQKAIEGEKERAKAGMDGNVALKEAEIFLSNFAAKQEENNNLYLSGKMSAQDYYSAITDAEYNVQMLRQESMNQMQELATLEMQIGNESFMHAQRLTQERINLLNFYQQTYNTAHQGMAAFTVMLGQTIQTNLSKALLDVTMNVHNSKDAFKQLEKAMIQAILNFMIQKAVATALEKTLLAETVASTSAAASAIALAWAPAAIAASIATLGGAAATGTAAYGLSLTTGIMQTMAATTAANAAGRSISVESQMSGGGQVLSQTPGFAGPQADGGDYMVNRPTLFLAGEAGPERATFTPANRISQHMGGGQTFIEIIIDRPTVSNRDDIDYLAEQVSKKLALEVERIR